MSSIKNPYLDYLRQQRAAQQPSAPSVGLDLGAQQPVPQPSAAPQPAEPQAASAPPEQPQGDSAPLVNPYLDYLRAQKKPAIAPAQEPAAEQPEAIGAVDTAGMLGKSIWDAVVYHTPAAVAAVLEGSEPFETDDWKDRLIERARKRASETTAKTDRKTAIPGISEQDIGSLGPSLGFSAAAAGAGLAAGVPAATAGGLAGPVGSAVAGYSAGGAASGAAAYNAATNQFVRDLYDAANEQHVAETGEALPKEQFKQRQDELADVIRSYGLWEAIPEAVGNVATFGILKAPVKSAIGKLFGKNVAARLATKLGSMYGAELATETTTQMGQQRAESSAGLDTRPPRQFTSGADWAESFGEIAGPVLLQTTLMAGAGKTGIATYDRMRGRKETADNQTPLAPEQQKAADSLLTPSVSGPIERVPQGAPPAESTAETWSEEQALAHAQARLQELERAGKGTSAKQVVGPNGKPLKAPGEQARFLTPAEKIELEFLRDNAGNAKRVAQAYGVQIGAAAAPQTAAGQAASDTKQPVTPAQAASSTQSTNGPPQQPVETWGGVGGEGYTALDAAKIGLERRKKAAPHLDWSIAQLPSGKYQLYGYAKPSGQAETEQPPAAGIGQAPVAEDAQADVGSRNSAQRSTEDGFAIPDEFSALFDEQGRRRFPSSPDVKDFKERNGLGNTAVRVILAAVGRGDTITLEEARKEADRLDAETAASRERSLSAEGQEESSQAERQREEKAQAERDAYVAGAGTIDPGMYEDAETGLKFEVTDGGIVFIEGAGGDMVPHGRIRKGTSGGADSNGVAFASYIKNGIVKRTGDLQQPAQAGPEAGDQQAGPQAAQQVAPEIAPPIVAPETPAAERQVVAPIAPEMAPESAPEALPETAQAELAVDRPPIEARPAPEPDDVAVTAAGTEVPVRYAVVEADDLVASQTDDGRTNRDYPQALQPRDRSRGVSGEQVRSIAEALNPRLLDRSPRASDGAPIVSAGGVVESGNGRVLAIRQAYRRGLPTAAAYRQHLASQGYPVEGMTNPVLVRVRSGEMTPAQRMAFARQANERDTLAMSATEQAMADAQAMPAGLLEQYRGGDVDDVANRDFVRGFLGAVAGRNDLATLVSRGGEVSQDAVRRIQGALLAKAYGDADLVSALVESTDANIKAIGGALLDVAPAWAQMRAAVSDGAIDASMDQTERLLDAVRLVQRARRERVGLGNLVGQSDMLSGNAVHPVAEAFLRLMYRDTARWSRPVGRDRLGDALRHYLDMARRAQPGVDLLGDTAPAPEQILSTAREATIGQDQQAEQATADIFAQPAGRASGDGGLAGKKRAASKIPGSEAPRGETAAGVGKSATTADAEVATGKAPDAEATAPTKESIDAAAHEAATSVKNDLPPPTEAQIDAGNYAKGHVRLHGLDISIENPKGSKRRPEWKPLAHHYGYIRKTDGADGDHIDVFLGPKAHDPSLPVFVVDQVNPQTRRFDEHKVLLGFPDKASAKAGYLANYEEGWKGAGGITRLSLEELRKWLKVGDTKKRLSVVKKSTLKSETEEAAQKREPGKAKAKRGAAAKAKKSDESGKAPAAPKTSKSDLPMFSRRKRDETRDLIVQHNLTAENVLHADRMGGLAVPSLAVTTVTRPLNKFGGITLLGDRDLADPRRGTQVFGADIYSPRYPTVSYKLDAAARSRLEAALKPHVEKLGDGVGTVTRLDDLTDSRAFRRYAEKLAGHETNYDERVGIAEQLLLEVGANETLFKGFTNTGRRYVPHTLENVVKALKKELRGGEGFNYGLPNLRAKVTPRFRSVEAIRKSKDKLVTRADFEAVRDEMNAGLDDLATRISADIGSYRSTDTVTQVLTDAVSMGIPRALRVNNLPAPSAETQQAMARFLNKLRDMPTEYFEAIIPRVAQFSEFKAAVVPTGTDPRAVAVLRRSGLKIVEYEKGNDIQRQIAIEKAAQDEGLLFSRAAPVDTNSPAFKRWFKGSKAVDPDGKPLAVYHGTTGVITQFDPSRRGENTGAESAGMGFFFSDDAVTAGSYANYAATDARIAALLREAEAAEKRGDWDAYDEKVVEYEALDASFSDPQNRLAGQNIVPVYLALKNPLRVDAKGESVGGFDIPDAIKRAVKGGHDGLIIDNLDDAVGLANRPATHFVAFRNTQIKSAISNTGEYSDTNPDITASRGTGPAAGHTVAAVEAEIAQQLGRRAYAKLRDRFVVVADTDALREDMRRRGSSHVDAVDDTVKGLYDPSTETSYIVAGNMTAQDSAWGTFLHEVGEHYGLDRMLGKAGHANVLRQAEVLLRAGVKPLRAAAEQVNAAENVGLDPRAKDFAKQFADRMRQDKRLAREVVAYLAEDPANHNMPLMRRITAAVRAFLRKLGILKNLRTDDIVALVIRAARSAGGFSRRYSGDTDPVGQPLFMRDAGAPDQKPGPVTEADDLNAWAYSLPLAGDTVDGRSVMDHIPNQSSIDATIENNEVIDGVRAVPLSAFDYQPGKPDARTLHLAQQIKESNEIAPLIVAVDDKGIYIIEGAHRIDALIHLGAKELPALVVIDRDAVPAGQPSRDRSPYAAPQDPVGDEGDRAGPLFSRVRGTPDQEQAIEDTIGPAPGEKRFGRFMASIADAIGGVSANSIRQGLFDSFRSIAAYEERANNGRVMDATTSAWKMALTTKNLHTVVTAMMVRGPIELVGGEFRLMRDRKGLIEIFKPLADKGLLRLWEGWAAANRAQRLMAEGREHNFKQNHINTLLTLETQYPEFRRVLDEYQEFNKAVLDLAEAAGAIDPVARAAWERNDYVPFYRIMEDAQEAMGPPGQRGIAKQRSGIRELRGGEQRIGSVLENIVMNMAHLVDVAYKNEAMRRTVALTEGIGMHAVEKGWRPTMISDVALKRALEAHGVAVGGMTPGQKAEWSRVFARVAPQGSDIVWVLEAGKPVYYRVTDPLLLRSVLSFGPKAAGAWMKILKAGRTALTKGATATPEFMAANFVRDTLATWVVSDRSLIPLWSAAKGFVKALTGSGEAITDIMTMGGMGHGFYDVEPQDLRRSMEDKVGLHPAGIVHTAWRLWQRIGFAFEQANRIAIYEATIKKGGSRAEAAHQARDILDFSMRGDWPAIQFIAETVPFFNARLQGLYKVGRGFADHPVGFFIKGSLLTAATLALLAANNDDDRYAELPEWEKDLYWHFWIGEEHFRIPKPFEIGAVFATIPERTIRASSGKDTAKTTGQAALRMVFDTFMFNPIPQLFMPVLEDAMNYSVFTGGKVVPTRMQYLPPELQYDPWTSESLRELAKVMPGPSILRSPKRMENLLYGYFGGMSKYLLGITDRMVRVAGDYPEEPESRVTDIRLIGKFYRGATQGPTRYSDVFYDMLDEAEEAANAVRELQRQGRIAEANAVKIDKARVLRARLALSRQSRRISEINKIARNVYYSTTMTPAQKRARLDELDREKNRILRSAVLRFEQR